MDRFWQGEREASIPPPSMKTVRRREPGGVVNPVYMALRSLDFLCGQWGAGDDF